jgi:hypothetical protein
MACTNQRINNWTDKISRKFTVSKLHRVKFCVDDRIFDRHLPDSTSNAAFSHAVSKLLIQPTLDP